eukprot:gb/GEZN01007036.1/.p1 GENE.gb/GEZN01007036.1/~~gb/GEZN01007036.1/.p1  ORF type:complete len:166 (+),score=19.65 gb/GEZN01007036.1/:721-1218(+)
MNTKLVPGKSVEPTKDTVENDPDDGFEAWQRLPEFAYLKAKGAPVSANTRSIGGLQPSPSLFLVAEDGLEAWQRLPEFSHMLAKDVPDKKKDKQKALTSQDELKHQQRSSLGVPQLALASNLEDMSLSPHAKEIKDNSSGSPRAKHLLLIRPARSGIWCSKVMTT